MAWAMDIAGAGVPSPNRIVLLRDADGDGVAETRSNFLEGLNCVDLEVNYGGRQKPKTERSHGTTHADRGSPR